MTYTLEEINLNDDDTELEIRELIKAAFNEPKLLQKGFIAKNITSIYNKPAFFLAAKENGKIIGCNAFITYDCFLNGQKFLGYQSCWTATHPAHQGKKVFVNLINKAKEILKMGGGGFLYGVANNNSNPIFTKKLDFTEFPSLTLRILNIPFYRKIYFNLSSTHEHKNSCFLDEEQVKRHKQSQSLDKIFTIKKEKSWIWGKVINKKKFGIKFSVFLIGGIIIDNHSDLKCIIAETFSKYKVAYIEIISSETHSCISLFKRWRNSKGRNGFIFFNLNLPTFNKLDLMIGSIDVF